MLWLQKGGISIHTPNQVWALDTTYIAMPQGFMYATVVIDWCSRMVLAIKVATTLESYHASEVLTEAVETFGIPEIINTDQGSQFTDTTFVKLVTNTLGCKFSMVGTGSWIDNVIVERFFRTFKYEHVYLHAYESIADGTMKIKNYITEYNKKRPHGNISYRTPYEKYYGFVAQSILKVA